MDSAKDAARTDTGVMHGGGMVVKGSDVGSGLAAYTHNQDMIQKTGARSDEPQPRAPATAGVRILVCHGYDAPLAVVR